MSELCECCDDRGWIERNRGGEIPCPECNREGKYRPLPDAPPEVAGQPQKCYYCDNPAIKRVVWLKDKRQQPAEIKLPWCGCSLMDALKRYWPMPYQIVEGEDFRIEELTSPISSLRERLQALPDLPAESFNWRMMIELPNILAALD